MKKRLMIWIVCIGLLGITVPTFAYSNQEYGWGTAPPRNEVQPDAGPVYNKLLQQYDGAYVGEKDKKIIYLTFDNGYERENYTTLILDTLKEKKVPAAFFITGHFIEHNPQLVKRMVEDGHIVGNHTFHHPALPQVDDAKLKEELRLLKDAYTKLTGKSEMKYMRPPEGRFSERTLALAKEEGYYHIFWSVAFLDWNVNSQRGAQYALNSVIARIHPGAIVLLHSISKDNVDALGSIIDTLLLKGYEFKSLDDLYSNRQNKQTSQ
ncbi:MAG: delta-lactam-biosynthetic de-N-acetylase [Bacillaceae bacterium]